MSEKTVREQFAQTLLEIGKEDPSLVVLVGDISHSILQPFAKACAGRYYNIGICEPTMLSVAAGLSKGGFHSVVHTINPFIVERSFEQIKLDFGYHGLGGNIATIGGAFDYSTLGCSHHCYGDFALMKTIPGTWLTSPSSAIEFDSLFRHCYNKNRLVFYRLSSESHGMNFKKEDITFGKAIRVTKGNDLSIFVTGTQLKNVLKAHKRLELDGLSSEIIYIHTLRPLDIEMICSSVFKTKNVLVVEEHVQCGGLGQDVLNSIKDLTGVRFSSLCIPEKFLSGYGSYEFMCQTLGLSEEGIYSRVKKEFLTTNHERSLAA